MSIKGLPPEPFVCIHAPADDFDKLKKADVAHMLDACAEVLSCNGETPDKVVQEMLPSLRDVIEAWWSAAFTRG